MKYSMMLGGRRIEGVTDIKETVRRGIREYLSVGGDPFCSDRGRSLKSWTVTAEICLYDGKNSDDLLERLSDMAKRGKPQLLSVSCDLWAISCRVLLKEMTVDSITEEACTVRLQLLEYFKPNLSSLKSSRAGDIPDPPSAALAKDAYLIITKYQNAGETVKVKNPETGVEIDNLAVMDADTVVSIEKAG